MPVQTEIGKLTTIDAGRDAIHIAVIPKVAENTLHPASYVMVNGEVVGIVDPFLQSPVYKGEIYWLFLLPNTITSLKHNWTHPAFDNTLPRVQKTSEQWLKDFLANTDAADYETTMEAIRNHDFSYGLDFLVISGQDAHGTIPKEFWNHVANVLGENWNKEDTLPEYFSCAC